MKSRFDLKHDTGWLQPENLDDLWLLSTIITPGSLITARTLRTIEIRRGEEKEKVGKRPVTLTIEAQKIELNQTLRLGGKIVESPPEIPHGWHTIEVKPGIQIKVVKKWKLWEIDKIKAAAKAAVPVLVCILDEREADIWLIKERSKHLAHIKAIGVGKEELKNKRPEFYGEIISALKRSPEAKHIIVAGPGFEKENILKFIKAREKELSKKITIDSVSHTGTPGLHELIKRKTLERVLKESRLTEEVELVESFFEQLAKGGNVAYGPKEISTLAEVGAVELLLISDKKVREFEQIMETVEKMKGKIKIVSSQHPAGERLLGIGGIAAILRFKP